MPGLRAAGGALVGAAGLLLAMVCLPAAASAVNISITYAGPDSAGDPYDLTIIASDGNNLPIQTMTAHVFNASMTDVADVPMSAQSTSSPTSQTWAATTPISQAALPPGTYSVTVDAADADESDTLSAGFSFGYTTSTLTVTVQPPFVTQGSQSVTFTGTLTGSAPGGTAAGIGGAPVLLSVGGASSTQVATTNSSGNFSYTATGISQTTDYDFAVAGTSTYPAPPDKDVTVPADQAVTTMTAQASSNSVTVGAQNVTFTGTVQVTPPNSQTPVSIGAGVPVNLSVNGGPVTQVATTGSNGNYSYLATGINQNSNYQFSVAGTNLYSSAQAPAAISITTQAAPTAISVTPSPNPAYITFGSQSVTFNGTVTATPAGGSAVGIGSGWPVYLSIAGGPATQVTTTSDASGDFSYTASGLTVGGSYAFSVAGTSLYQAASQPVQVSLNPATTSVQVTASPPDIDLDTSTVTFSGTVSVLPYGSSTLTSAGSGVPVFLTVGSGTASQVATTDSGGAFSYTATGVTQAADYVFSVQPPAPPDPAFYAAGSDSVPIGLDQVNSALSVIASPASVTEGSQTVSFSGTLTGTSPEGRNPVAEPIANAPVDVTFGGSTPVQIGTTDTHGNFSYAASGVSQATDYTFTVGSTGTYTAASEDVQVAAVQAATRFTSIKVKPSALAYGQTATLTGVVQYQSGTTWTPLPNVTVHLAEGKKNLPTVPTSATGAFTAKLSSTNGTFWTATVAAGSLIQQLTTTAGMSITVPVKVTSFKASLSPSDKVRASGCIEATDSIGYGPQSTINIQYSSSRHGPWKVLGSLPLRNLAGRPSSCNMARDSYFTGSIKAKLANAYYRADFPGSKSLQIYSFKSVTSGAVHAWKYKTRIISFSVAPRTVRKGQSATLKCRLEVFGKSWKPWAGQKITFRYNYKDYPTVWESLKPVRTNSQGYATTTIAGISGTFVVIMHAFYLGDSKHLASQTQGINLTNRNSSHATIGRLDQSTLVFPQLATAPVLPEPYPAKLSLTELLAG